ncbi:hypothetical protein ACFLSY_12075 [Bacteroidota bacterium]
MESKKKEKRKIWDFPWSYKESFFIAFGIVAIGFIIELLTNSSGGFGLHLPPGYFYPGKVNYILSLSFLE